LFEKFVRLLVLNYIGRTINKSALRGKSKQEIIINKMMLFVKALTFKFNRHETAYKKYFMIFVRIHSNISLHTA